MSTTDPQATAYPAQPAARDAWILARRSPRNPMDPHRPHAFLIEDERAESGEIIPIATIFLTNRECPWRCLMCDLWKNTSPESVPPGAISEQIRHALAHLNRAAQGRPGCAPRAIKLYNSGSFFDPRAIPVEDHHEISGCVRPFERVIVECHPALVNERVLRFRERLTGQLEVAMGLETAHPGVLEKLNKRMTLDQFARAADFLRQHRIALRVFVLVKPPFLDEGEALEWAQRSIDVAFDCGATVVSLIPVRFGNGALEALARTGQFSPPRLRTLELAAAYGVRLQRGRVFADLWDLEQFSSCGACFASRTDRLAEMNHSQCVAPEVECTECPPG